MHNETCICRKCRLANEVHWNEFWGESAGNSEAGFGESGSEGPFSESEAWELAAELLAVSTEAELDRFLGSLVKRAWSGVKKVGQVAGRLARPLGGVLRTVAKTALPFVGGALGSFIPIPGVGTALGSALGGALSQALEAELGELNHEERELEMAHRFVQMAGTAARLAADAAGQADPRRVVERALTQAARQHLPGLPANLASGRVMSPTGRWHRRGHVIVVSGV